MPRPDRQRWVEKRFGPDALGVGPMEAWAEHIYGANWRNQIRPRKPKTTRRVLHVEDVMADCRAWFLANVPGDGLRTRAVVNVFAVGDPLRAARRRLDQHVWDLCSVCNVPVYDNEWEMEIDGPRHPQCQPDVERDCDAPARPAAA